MKKVLVSFLILIFACAAVFAAEDIVKVIGKVESGAGDPTDGIKVNGISLEFAIKGNIGADPKAPTSWDDSNDDWMPFPKEGDPSVYVDLTGNIGTIADAGGSSHTAFDSFYICFRALGNNLDANKIVSVSFSSKGLKKTGSDDYPVALNFDLDVTSPESEIEFKNDTDAINVIHPAKDMRGKPAYGGYAYVTWDQNTGYSAGEYTGDIKITINSVQ